MIDLDVRRLERSGATQQIVFVHGALDRGANFSRTASAVVEHDVVTYTRRGYDRTASEGGATIDVHVADLLRILGSRPSIVVGHSFGALVAIGAAAEEPELVTAVGAFEPPMPWLSWWPPIPDFRDPADAAEDFFIRVVGQDVWQALPEQWRDARRREGRALIADFDSARNGPTFDPRDLLSPVRTAFGSDSTKQFKRAAQELADQVHQGEATAIEGAAHGIHMTHPGEFARWAADVAAVADG